MKPEGAGLVGLKLVEEKQPEQFIRNRYSAF